MIEEEAKKTECPIFVLGFIIASSMASLSGKSSAKKIGDFGEATIYCRGSACQWWAEDEWIKTKVKGQEGHFINEPAGHCGAINK